jgi:hypothetical protein
MTQFEAYQLYNAINLHFTQASYDYHMYRGKTRVTEHSLDIRPDKYMFYKLSKHEDPITYLVSNFSENSKFYSRDMFSAQSDLNYNNFIKRQQALTYHFECDIDNLLEEFDKNFEVPDGDYPYLLKLLTRKKISKETFIIIQDCVRFFGRWNKQITDTVLWPKIAMNCKKLHPFLTYDHDKYRGILKNKFSQTS